MAGFNTPQGIALTIEEIQTFNQGPRPIGTLYWLMLPGKRSTQCAGSAAVAFATKEEADRAIRNRLCIAGTGVRVEKLYSTVPTTQCHKCQGFGHLENHCKEFSYFYLSVYRLISPQGLRSKDLEPYIIKLSTAPIY